MRTGYLWLCRYSYWLSPLEILFTIIFFGGIFWSYGLQWTVLLFTSFCLTQGSGNTTAEIKRRFL